MTGQILKDFRVRTASCFDVQQLTGLVRRTKAYWGYPQEWMDAWRTELTVTSDYVLQHHVVVLEDEHQIAGFYGLEITGDVAHLEHLWVEPMHIGFSSFG